MIVRQIGVGNPNVDRRLLLGATLSEVGRWIQRERSECLGPREDSVVTALVRYRDDLPDGRGEDVPIVGIG